MWFLVDVWPCGFSSLRASVFGCRYCYVLLCIGSLLLEMSCPCLVETFRQLHVTVRTKKLARPSVLGIWMPPDVTLIGNILSLCRCHTFANPKAG